LAAFGCKADISQRAGNNRDVVIALDHVAFPPSTSMSRGLRHRAFAALLALADRCSGDSFSAFALAALRASA
jgi:hypothetical protein